MEKNIKLFMLKDSTYLIGDLKEGSLKKVLQVGLDTIEDPKTGRGLPAPFCMPLGYPINQKAIDIELKHLDIYFEVEDVQETIVKVYEDTLLKIENPHVKVSNPSKIIY